MKHILALVPGGIGDQLLFFPTLENLKQAYPDAEIDPIVEPRALGAYRVCPLSHEKSLETIRFDFTDRNGLADWSNLLGIIRDREYDAVLSYDRTFLAGFMLWLTGISNRVGYRGSAADLFYTHTVPLKTEQYKAQLYGDLLSGLGIPAADSVPRIALLKEDLSWAEAEQKRLGIGESGYILIHGNCSQLSKFQGVDKSYPPEKWLPIIARLRQQQPELPIVVACGPDDILFVNQLAEMTREFRATTPGDIGKLAAMVAGANLMLCTDSAPLQLAVAVETPTVALFGPTDPEKRLPKSDKVSIVQSPTGKMADIDPEAVLKRLFG
ncbi:MAG TPA: glycosyltransferase family 9 protein [Oscillatoriales cyanobacterium M59_W2019_021]|nr:MAG: lipopolysaccharide heptosyltransferase family protein [Cyanobacteria bacterium J055]HIK31019.1 glycosyltransferase family 9 protein [Oscillatoriales cyanobacterium M4454_W2019_049]HIK50457.1 glycosyltransferase family 9 protein [Oscillatoriales cyanobacterium M59_W2019_021]